MKELLKSLPLGEAQLSYQSSSDEERMRVAKAVDDRQRIFRAFKLQEEVCYCTCMCTLWIRHFAFTIACIKVLIKTYYIADGNRKTGSSDEGCH